MKRFIGALLIASAAHAQSVLTIHGVAYDSLHAKPLAGAFVSLATRSATTDDKGRFVFDSIAPGTYRLVMQHDALDSLGMSGTMRRVTITDGKDLLQIAVPSFTTLWRAACGSTVAPADSGLLFGTVKVDSGALPRSLKVDASWVDVGFDKRSGVTQKRWRLESPIDPSGNYTLCGVPLTTGIRVFTLFDSTKSGGFVDLLPLDKSRVARTDLTVNLKPADTTATGVIVGQVNADTAGVRDALVVAEGVPDVRTDSGGRFAIRGVPVGIQQVEVRAIGHQPVFKTVEVRGNDTVRVVVNLSKVTLLDSMVTRSSIVREQLIDELRDRVKTGLGYYKDSTFAAQHSNLTALFREIQGVRIVPPGCPARACPIRFDASGSARTRNGGTCLANLWLDGVRQFDQNILESINPDDIALIEAYPRMASTPMKYVSRGAGMDMCGTVLIWTKRIVRK
jgi:hypothetical protein